MRNHWIRFIFLGLLSWLPLFAEAAIAFRSSSTATSGTTSVTPAEPSGAQENDIIFVYVTTASGTAGPWMDDPSWQNVYYPADFRSPYDVAIFWIRRGASAPNLTASASNGGLNAVATAWSGVIKYGNPIDVKGFVEGTASPGQPNPPSVTTTVTNTMVLAFGDAPANYTTGGATPPTGYTLATGTGASGANLAVAYKTKAATGAENPANFTNTNTGSATWSAFTVALKPHVAPVALRSQSEDGWSGVTSATITEPTGAAQNDILLMAIIYDNGGVSNFLAPAGWTEFYNQTGGNLTSKMYWIRRGASAPALGFSWTGSTWFESATSAWTGCILNGSPFDTTASASPVFASPPNPDPPSITTTAEDSTIVIFGTVGPGYITGGMTPPAGYTFVSGSAFTDVGVAYKNVEAIGTTDNPGTMTNIWANPDYGFAATVALKAQPVVGYRNASYIWWDDRNSTAGIEPEGTKEGDILIMAAGIGPAISSFVGPTGGWTQLYDLNYGGCCEYTLKVWWIRRGASPPDYTMSWTHDWGGNAAHMIAVTAWKGTASSGSPFDVTAGTTAQPNPANPDPPSVTTTVTNTVIYAVGASNSTFVPPAYPANYTGLQGPSYANLVSAYRNIAATGAQNPAAFTGTGAGAGSTAMATLAIKPDVGTATTTKIRHKVFMVD